MAKVDISIYGYPRDEREIRNTTLLNQFLTDLAKQGYHLIDSAEVSSYSDWLDAYHHPQAVGSQSIGSLFQPGRSPQLQQAFNTFTNAQAAEFSSNVLSTARTGRMQAFHFQFGLSSQEGLFSLSIEDIFFTQRDAENDNTARYELWLALLEEISTLWHPIYAFSSTDVDEEAPVTRDEVVALSPIKLTDIMIFGPELVAKFGGIQRILATPAWRIKMLADGSALIVAAPAIRTPEMDHIVKRQQVADYLGIPYQRVELNAAKRLKALRQQFNKNNQP
jgi:hypothetical protein